MEDLEYRVGKLSMAPGDVLVVKLGRTVNVEEAQRVRRYVGKAVGEGVPVLIIDGNVDLSVLTKAEIEAKAG